MTFNQNNIPSIGLGYCDPLSETLLSLCLVKFSSVEFLLFLTQMYLLGNAAIIRKTRIHFECS